ncbi:FMN adenylyltransferase [bacterium]|nr:MAG: FMN adenylyltransferase [bacterium]
MDITIFGKVVRGKSKGKILGFPTANINLDGNDKIESGVYAGSVKVGDKTYKAGIFVNSDGALLEAHIIGFSGDLYGKEIEVEIREKMRDIIKFKSEEALKRQIKKDIEFICLRE